MTDRARREWAARYASGTMTADERTRFEQELPRDRRLHSILDAEMMIAGTLVTVGARPVIEHAATRAHVMGRLAALPKAAVPAAGVAAAGGISLVAKIIIGAVVGAGAVAGGYYATHETDGPERTQHAPAVAPQTPADVATPLAGTPVDSMPLPAAPAAEPAASTVPAEIETARVEHAAARQAPHATNTAPAAAPPAVANTPATAADAPRPPAKQIPVVIRRNDHFDMHVSVPKGTSESKPK